MTHRVRLTGIGRVELAAYGTADAEHQVEKELGRIWPDATVAILGIEREDTPRIVENFRITYRVRLVRQVDAPLPATAGREAARAARSACAGGRYRDIEWVKVEAELDPPT